jgi:hypothetical protein
MKAAIKRFLSIPLSPLVARWRYVAGNLSEIQNNLDELRLGLDGSRLREEDLRARADEAIRRASEILARVEEVNARNEDQFNEARVRDEEISARIAEAGLREEKISAQNEEVKLHSEQIFVQIGEIKARIEEVNGRNEDQFNEVRFRDEEISARIAEVGLREEKISAQNEEMKLHSEQIFVQIGEIKARIEEVNARNEDQFIEVRFRDEAISARIEEFGLLDGKISAQNEEVKLHSEQIYAQIGEIKARIEEVNARNEDQFIEVRFRDEAISARIEEFGLLDGKISAQNEEVKLHSEQIYAQIAEIKAHIEEVNSRNDQTSRMTLEAIRVGFSESLRRGQELEAELAQLSEEINRSNRSLLDFKADAQTKDFDNWSADKRVLPPVYGGDSARVLAAMRLLAPWDVRDRGFRRLGREFDGGYVMVDDFSMVQAVVSCGIESEVSWDREMAELGFDVHQYDHTVGGPPEPNSRFMFHKLAIRASDAEEGITIRGIVAGLGRKAKGAILKLDIERSEWPVLEAVDEKTLMTFSQILVEFHEMHYMPIFMEKAEAAFQKLARHFFVAHLHANNHEDAYSIGGVIVPRVLEVTFANRAWFEPVPLTRTFPTDLDRRNDPRRPELHLGRFAY